MSVNSFMVRLFHDSAFFALLLREYVLYVFKDQQLKLFSFLLMLHFSEKEIMSASDVPTELLDVTLL